MKLERITISAKRGIHATQAADIVLQNVKIITPESPPVTQKDTSNIQFVN